jgi:hypothetical protein
MTGLSKQRKDTVKERSGHGIMIFGRHSCYAKCYAKGPYLQLLASLIMQKHSPHNSTGSCTDGVHN